MNGDLLALGSAVCFAIANVTIVKGATRDAADNGAFLSLLMTAAIAGAGWVAMGLQDGFRPVTGTAFAWFAGAGVLTAFIGRVFVYASIQNLGAMRASALKRLNPFFAVALGVGILGERLTTGMMLGMAFIVASFVLLVAGTLRARAPTAPHAAERVLNIGYLYGTVSALGYAFGYLLRKAGLNEMPDAFFGTMVGAVVAVFLFVAMGAFNANYARAVAATFRNPNRWLFAAGAMSSCGQIFYFFALKANPISRVALIASMEVFVTLFLSVVFLRKRESLTAGVALAAVLGVVGTGFIFADD